VVNVTDPYGGILGFLNRNSQYTTDAVCSHSKHRGGVTERPRFDSIHEQKNLSSIVVQTGSKDHQTPNESNNAFFSDGNADGA
jgi:hypothetical protein